MDNFVKAIEPLPQDMVVNKFRIGAFTGNELDIVLRSQNIQHLVLAGISTSGVVLTTVRDAADKDYKITVLADGCYDRDSEIHHCLIHKIFPKQADVVNIYDWTKL